MKTNKLNLLILDDNLAVTAPLTRYLNSRFGERINLSIFSDGNECIKRIGNDSHVLILNYAMKGEDPGAYNRQVIFRNLKQRRRKTEVAMFTSKQHVSDATDEMKIKIGNYIIKREAYLYNVLVMLDKVLIATIYNRMILPTRQLDWNFKIKYYVIPVLVSCIAAGIVIIMGLHFMDF